MLLSIAAFPLNMFEYLLLCCLELLSLFSASFRTQDVFSCSGGSFVTASLLLQTSFTGSSVFVPLFLFFRLSFFLLAFFSSKLTFLDFTASSFCVFFYEKKNKVQFYLCSISNSFTSLVLVLRLLDLRLLLLLDLLDL